MSMEKICYPNSQDVQYEWEKLPDGRRHGKACVYYKNGKRQREGEYHYDKEDGIWHEYDENGNEIRQIKYADGENKGWKEWDENHVLRCETKFSDGQCIAYTNYDKDGVITDKMYVDAQGVSHTEFYMKGRHNSTQLKYPDGTVIHKREESSIKKTLKESQKKAQARNTAIRTTMNKSGGRK